MYVFDIEYFVVTANSGEYDCFQKGSVKPECLEEGWITSESARVVRMAFNLFCNGTPSVYALEGDAKVEEGSVKY